MQDDNIYEYDDDGPQTAQVMLRKNNVQNIKEMFTVGERKRFVCEPKHTF